MQNAAKRFDYIASTTSLQQYGPSDLLSYIKIALGQNSLRSR